MSFVVHIGAPKTATSTLQSAFFPVHPGLYFLGKNVDRARAYEGWRTPQVGVLMKQLETGDLDFAPDPTAMRAMIEAIVRDSGERPVVLSDEGLCAFTGVDALAKLKRIKEIFAPLAPFKLIFCVREQLALIKSNYLTEHRGEMLRLAGTKQNWYPDFDRYLDIQFRYACGAFLDSFRYAAMIDRYKAQLGAENVLVYAFEEFVRDPLAVLRNLCRFIGIDENAPCVEQAAATRENEHQTSRMYAMNSVRVRLTGGRGFGKFMPLVLKKQFHRWLARGQKFDFTPSTGAIRRIHDYYRADNEALCSKHGIRL